MTRARARGEGVEAYGHPDRAEVYRRRDTFLGVWCDWVAIPAAHDRRLPAQKRTWRAAMDYALGLDIPTEPF